MTPLKICPVCYSSNTEFFAEGWDSEYKTSSEVFNYYYCKSCPVVFLFNPPSDRLEEIYPPNYYAFSEKTGQSFLHKIKKLLEVRMFRKILSHIPGNVLDVLDIGGGTGWLLNTIRLADPRVAETWVIDIDNKAKTVAENYGHKFYCERVEDFDDTRKFDFVILLNLLEHVVDPGALIIKLSGIVKPSGLILIKTPNIDTLDRYIFQKHNWGGLHCPRHWVLFNKKSLISLAESYGLELVSFWYTQGAHQWAASILGYLSDRKIISITPKNPLDRHKLYNPIVAIAAVFDLLRLGFSPTTQMFCLFRLKH